MPAPITPGSRAAVAAGGRRARTRGTRPRATISAEHHQQQRRLVEQLARRSGRRRGRRRATRRCATRPASTATTTGGQNSGRKTVVMASDEPARGSAPARNFSASIGSRASSSGLEPSAAASTPSGRSFFSTRKRTLSALTRRPNCSLTRSAISRGERCRSRPRRRGGAAAVSWMTCPSARRAMYGGSLKPEPSYSPISSMPSASFGAASVRRAVRRRGVRGSGGGAVEVRCGGRRSRRGRPAGRPSTARTCRPAGP